MGCRITPDVKQNIPPFSASETIRKYIKKKSTSAIDLDYYNVTWSIHLVIQNAQFTVMLFYFGLVVISKCIQGLFVTLFKR